MEEYAPNKIAMKIAIFEEFETVLSIALDKHWAMPNTKFSLSLGPNRWK